MAECNIKNCHVPKALIFRRITIPAAVADDTVTPPENGAYCNELVVYEATGNAYLYSSDGIPTKLTVDLDAYIRLLDDESEARKTADNEIWDEIEKIEVSSDVADVVGTYAELQAYDTSKLTDNDLIKVLQDETHSGAITYYRWSTSTESFSYVGEEGPYYTQSQVDTKLSDGSVTKLGTSTVGNSNHGVYWNNGAPAAVDVPSSGAWFRGAPTITNDGVMEIGKYIDFHNTNSTTDDYSTRIYSESTSPRNIALPNRDGTLAVTSDVKDATLTIQHNGNTVQTFTANSETNKTANIQTIYKEDITVTDPITQLVQTDMIATDAVTARKIDRRNVGVLEPVLTTSVGDNGTATYTINNFMPDTFIYINTHINVREIVMLTYLGGFGMRQDVILRSSSSVYSTFSINGNVLTITGAANCRGQLYLLRASNAY